MRYTPAKVIITNAHGPLCNGGNRRNSFVIQRDHPSDLTLARLTPLVLFLVSFCCAIFFLRSLLWDADILLIVPFDLFIKYSYI